MLHRLRKVSTVWRRATWLLWFARRDDIERPAVLALRYLQLIALARFAPRWRRPFRFLGYRVVYTDVVSLRWIFGEIFISRDYAPPSDVDVRRVVDAGANIGMATLFFKHHFPDAEIICFEPDPRAYRCLRQNVERNGLTGVTTHNVGLGERRERATLFVNPTVQDSCQSVSSTFAEAVMEDGSPPEELSIDLAPLAEFVDGPIDILKIDVEGSELAALRGAGSLLERVRTVAMEYHRVPEAPLHEVLGVLAAAGHEYDLVTPVRTALGAVGVIRTVRADTAATP